MRECTHLSERERARARESKTGSVIYTLQKCMLYNSVRPRMEKLHSGRPRTSRFTTFLYWQVVNRALMRLLITIVLVYYRVVLIDIIKVSTKLYYRFLLLYSFGVCETYICILLHVNSATMQFLHFWVGKVCMFISINIHVYA